MPTQSGISGSDIDSAITSAIRDLDGRIRLSEQNQEAKIQYEAKLKQLTANYEMLAKFIEDLKPKIDDITEYLGKKRKESMNNINNAIRLASEVIPDAGEGIFFEVDGDKAWLSTADGLEVARVEGRGFQQVSSAFLRSVLIESNPGILHTLIADEIFSLVSPENSAKLSLYLNVILQEMQVISIEQKPQVYSNVDCRFYSFVKGDKYSTITYEDVKRGEPNAG